MLLELNQVDVLFKLWKGNFTKCLGKLRSEFKIISTTFHLSLNTTEKCVCIFDSEIILKKDYFCELFSQTLTAINRYFQICFSTLYHCYIFTGYNDDDKFVISLQQNF